MASRSARNFLILTYVLVASLFLSLSNFSALFLIGGNSDYAQKVVRYRPVPNNFTEEIHFVVMLSGPEFWDCGGCAVLWELYRVLDRAYPHVDKVGLNGDCPKFDSSYNRTFVFIYPEVSVARCAEMHPMAVHVHWILAPIGVHVNATFPLQWKSDEFVMNFATSYGSNVPISNILQVVTKPKVGDDTDVSDEVFYNKNRSGIAWMIRKGRQFHKNIKFIHEIPGINATHAEGLSVEMLPSFEYFVAYDPYTFWSLTAAMLGVVSVVYPIENVSKINWAYGSFFGSYLMAVGETDVPGIAYGWVESELEYARRTMHELRPFLFKVKAWGDATIHPFGRDCYRHRHGEREFFESAMLVKDAYPHLYPNETTNSTK